MYHSTLYLVGEDGSLVLSGVTSYGTGCGDEGEGKREKQFLKLMLWKGWCTFLGRTVLKLFSRP